jgi:uncharacterized phage-associated protein
METKKTLGKVDSIILAEYILQNFGAMSHLKLQKIIYYIEALHLAYFDKSLIDDDFQAWLHGPVSRKIYDALKGYSVLYSEVEYKADETNRNPTDLIKSALTEDQVVLMTDILTEYSKLTSYQLETLTHEETPWIEARKGVPIGDRCENIISKETMRTYYKKELFA